MRVCFLRIKAAHFFCVHVSTICTIEHSSSCLFVYKQLFAMYFGNQFQQGSLQDRDPKSVAHSRTLHYRCSNIVTEFFRFQPDVRK